VCMSVLFVFVCEMRERSSEDVSKYAVK
jgi:hypothetical protein